VEYVTNAAQAAKDTGDLRGALHHLKRLVQLQPHNVRFWELLGAYAEAVGDTTLAGQARAEAHRRGSR
jgi:Flp pilus assembly protein TadD